MDTTDKRLVSLNCFNPFSKPNHSHARKSLRTVTSWMCDLIPGTSEFSKVCDSCRKHLKKLKDEKCRENFPGTSHVDEESQSDTDIENAPTDIPFSNKPEALKSLNSSLLEMGESPVDKKKMQFKMYSTEKSKKINIAVKRKLLVNADTSNDKVSDSEDEFIKHVKEVYNSCSRKKKVMLLTLLPDSWSVRKIMQEFSAPNYLARQAKTLLKKKGALSSPDLKPGKSLPNHIVDIIKGFYESDEISRVMPGMKDFISVKDSTGGKVHVSKRLILNNLKEAYKFFREKFPSVKVGFSKFAELRPKNCVLAGQSGTHSVCVCTIHQNVKLMFQNSRMSSMTDGEIKTYKDCLHMIICSPPSIDCFFSNCVSCPGTERIRELLEKAFEDNAIETVTYRQWIAVDRCTLEIIQKPVGEFVDVFCEKLPVLLRHHFTAKEQSAFLRHTKENLLESEVAVICDFSENYSFILQDEAQSYHWSKSQATIHPFVVYFKEEEEIKHFSFVIISDCLNHNTTAVYLFQVKLMEYLKCKFERLPKKIFYFSDGSASQYKNKKNFINLCNHKQDFGVEAEWHFSATAHGKGPCDGVGATVKRLAARASLQNPYEDQIINAMLLFEWAHQNISNIDFKFVTLEEYIKTEEQLASRYSKAVAISGTQKFHAFIPLRCGTKVNVKLFSSAVISNIFPIVNDIQQIAFANITGYVASIYGDAWWLSYVVDKNEEDNTVQVTFLYPSGPSPSFTYPTPPDTLWIPSTDVICKVNPITQTGRTYSLPDSEVNKCVGIFQQLQC